MLFDPLYLLIASPALIFVFYAQWKVNRAYKKFATVANFQGKTGFEVAEILLRANGITEVRVEETKGTLTDHYDPRKKVLRLSKEIYRVPSVSSMGIVAHEVGHAVQHKRGYVPMKVRGNLVPVANVGTWLGYAFFVLGMLLQMVNLVWIGVAFFSAAVFFALVTLPVEFDASARARQMLENTRLVTAAETDGVKAVLSAAALTYVGALLQAVSNLLYYILLGSGMSRRR